MKICSRCGYKGLDKDFIKSKRTKWCYPCKRAYSNTWNANRTPEQREKKLQTQRDRVNKHRQRIWNYLLKHPCIDCGETNPVVLDFDHRDDSTKLLNLGNACGLAWIKIKAEIAKCDVRCCKCHRIRTAKQFGYYNWLKIT